MFWLVNLPKILTQISGFIDLITTLFNFNDTLLYWPIPYLYVNTTIYYVNDCLLKTVT